VYLPSWLTISICSYGNAVKDKTNSVEVFSMGVNESTGGKMKKALKRIWDGPDEEETAEENSQPQEEILQAEVSKNSFPLKDNSEINAISKAMANDFSNTIKANLLKFKPTDGAEENDNVNSFAPYNAGRKGGSSMLTDATIDNTTNIFSAASANADNEVTTISEGTSIVGELRSSGNVEVLGNMKGNIVTKGNVTVCGKVMGDVKGADIELSSCTVQGNITATGTLTIDSDSVLVGDIKSENLSIDGKLKGNAQIRNMITCQSSALILGNVTAAVASINEGAKLQGAIQIINGQISEIKIADDEASSWMAKTPDSIPSIGLDK
jgi:cytoskeletal protein CcmA (bactofilin family)